MRPKRQQNTIWNAKTLFVGLTDILLSNMSCSVTTDCPIKCVQCIKQYLVHRR